jgi:Uroporphyrinogen-III decarboxylase
VNSRERIINTVLFKEVDKLPFILLFGAWPETLERWKREGFEEGDDLEKYFGFDPQFINIDINWGLCPWFVYEEVEDRGDTLIVRNSFGVLEEVKKGGSSIPRQIDFPVKDMESWERLKKERLDPYIVERFPANWKQLVENYKKIGGPVQVGDFPYGLFGTARELMGVEELCVSFYEQPDLVHDIMDYLTDFWLKIYEKVCMDIKVDCIHIWEDMSGKTGSIISPKLVKEFMTPNYKKIKAFADKNNIPIFSLDTDGDVSELLPIFVDCGINLVFPFEVIESCNILEYREKYPDLCIMGGIDKKEIAKGRNATDMELDRISKLFDYGGGYIPFLDHTIHPDISFEDFKYFVKRLKEIIGIN